MAAKIIFECDKGHQWEPNSTPLGALEIAVRKTEPCPICHPREPSYGPITVEMVAEMLYAAAYPGCKWKNALPTSRSSHLRRARAVIRLLHHLQAECDLDGLLPKRPSDTAASVGYETVGDYWRAKLLKLARGAAS